MIKRIVKYALCVLIILGVAISIANFFQPELHSDEFPRIVTYYKNPPDCYGDPTNCNDFTKPPTN